MTTIPGDGTTLYTLNASHTFLLPAMYSVSIGVEDSGGSCEAGTFFGVYAWGSGGQDPVNFSVNSTGGPAPLSVHFTANVTDAPPNATYNWLCFGSDGFSIEFQTGMGANCTYYQSGLSRADLWVTYGSGLKFWEGTTPWVNVTGSSVLTLEVEPAIGPEPLYGMAWVNVTNTSLLPAQYSLSLSMGPGAGCANNTPLSFRFNTPAPFGPLNFTHCLTYDTSFGVGSAEFFFLQMTNATNSSVFFQEDAITVLASPVDRPYPTLSLVVSPANGTAPLNVTFQASAQGGTPPYALQLGIEGAGPTLPNGTRTDLPFFSLANWTGGPLNITHNFSAGNYTVDALVTGLDGQQSWSIAQVAAVPPRIPLPLSVLAPAPVSESGSPTNLTFLATIEGGLPPYTVRWSFGDGAVGSSLSGRPFVHAYAAAGNYSVFLSVTDAQGDGVLRSWTVTIASSAPVAPPAVGSTEPSPWLLLTAGVGMATAAVASFAGLRLRRLKLKGERLLEEIEESSTSRRPPPLRAR